MGLAVLAVACRPASVENPDVGMAGGGDGAAGASGTGGTGGSGGGAAGSGGAGGGQSTCDEDWSCSFWSITGTTATRSCVDINGCGTTVRKPIEGPTSLPSLNLNYYKCKVQPIFDRGCGMMGGCHGVDEGRGFRTYSRGRLRNDEMITLNPNSCLRTQPLNLKMYGSGTVMCEGWMPHTAQEWQKNFDNARSFMIGVTDPAQSELLVQPTAGTAKQHVDVKLFAGPSDADYQTLQAWLSGATLATCDPRPN